MHHPIDAATGDRIAAFTAMLSSMERYAALLLDVAAVCRAGRMDPARPLALVPSECWLIPAPSTDPKIIAMVAEVRQALAAGTGVVSEYAAGKLESCSASIGRIRANSVERLRAADLTGALRWCNGLHRDVSGYLEGVAYGKTPLFALVPGAWWYFEPDLKRLETLFPPEADQPMQAAALPAFEAFLASRENPWAQ